MTADELQTVVILGGWAFLFAVMTALAVTALLIAALYRLALAVRGLRARRRILRAARRQLATFTTINDLKD